MSVWFESQNNYNQQLFSSVYAGQFVLIEVEAKGSEVKEFIRKANIVKTIWRHLVVNLDSESNMETLKNMKPFEPRAPREFRDREPREYKRPESSDKEAK